MKIDVSDVFENPGEVFESEQSGPFKSLVFQEESYDFADGAQVSVRYFGDEEGITVTGTFETKTKVSCARCLKEFMYPVKFDFTEYYKESPDDSQYAYTADMIELDEMLTDNFIINLPVRFLCDEQCKGLCQKCGKDLNEGSCGCEELPDESNPFYGLKGFIDDDEEV